MCVSVSVHKCNLLEGQLTITYQIQLHDLNRNIMLTYTRVSVATWKACITIDSTISCRFEECKTKLTPFLKTVGFNPKTGIGLYRIDKF